MQKLPLASFAAAAVLASGFLAFAQSTDSTTSGQTTEQTTEAPSVELTPDTVLVVVDGTSITLGEVIAVRQSLPDQYQQLPDEVLMAALVQQLADQQLLANAARAEGMEDSITVKLALRNQRRAVLADTYMATRMLERVNADVLAAAYTERFVNAEPVEEVRAAHILVETEEEAANLKTLLDGGAEFAALAAEHGTDGTASRGGDLGWFTKEQMVPEFANAVFAMDPGTVSDPVQTPFGWHLIKLEEKRDRPVPPMEEVQGELLEELTTTAQTDIIEELRAAGTVAPPETPVPDSAIREDALIVE